MSSIHEAGLVSLNFQRSTLVTGQWGYKAEDIVLLTDDASLPRAIPTRANMIDAMRWLVKDAHQHDSLFFHCERCVYRD